MKSWNIFYSLIFSFFIVACTSDAITPPYKDHPNLKTAELARARGDLPQAIHAYREIIKEDQFCEKAYIGLGMALLDVNEVDEARGTFEKALTLFPKSAAAFVGMGSIFLVLNQPENAIKSFNCALAIDPRNAKAINGHGLALDMLGDFLGAQVNYQAAIELDPCNLSYKSNLALSKALMGNTSDAIRELERLANSPQATPRIRQNLALAYGLAGNMKMARKIGRLDLSEDMVKNNVNYIEAIQKTKEYAGLISKNHTMPLDETRRWQEGD